MKNLRPFIIMICCCSCCFQLSLAQWTQSSNGLTNGYVYAMTSSPNGSGGTNLYAATSGGGVCLSTDNGSSWVAVGYPNLDAVSVAATGTYVFAGTNGTGIYVSSNYGVSWNTANVGLAKPWVFGFAVVANGTGGTNVFAGTYGGGVYVSTNNGASWTAVSSAPMSPYVFALAVSGTNIFAGTDGGGVYISTDNGSSWKATSLVTGTVHALAVSGVDIYAGTLGNGLWHTTDNGASWWTGIGVGFPNNYIWALATSGKNVYAGTADGVFLSTNTGTNWIRSTYGLANTYVRALAVSGTNLFAGTWGFGVWRRPLSDLTSVERVSAAVPEHFSLDQNYPNPFNPNTTIRFSLSTAANVSLRISNMLGEEIAVLVNERKEAGTYQTAWNASNVPSGIYIYRLRAGDFVETKKMVVLK